MTIWEVAIKRAAGKLRAPENLAVYVERFRLEELPITIFHGEQAGSLPLIHRDPFDRMLIAQAQAEGLVLVTNDAKIGRYGVRTMAAQA